MDGNYPHSPIPQLRKLLETAIDEARESTDPGQLEKLLDTVINKIHEFSEAQAGRIQRLTRIGIALSAEKNIDILLEMIIDEAMRFTHADAGTLYIVDDDAANLQFKILKNRTLKVHKGGTSKQPVKLPPVPLTRSGRPNHANVSSYAALTGEIVNIEDVYQAEGFDFTGPKAYDARTGYRSRSMLVLPMKNHHNEVIGVLQLLNATDPASGDVVPFSWENDDFVIALASQAAVALENARLIYDLQVLFDAFIESIATAIDEKSPYTAGHIRRVAELTMHIAGEVNRSQTPPFSGFEFTPEELEELRIAAWMHDVGKITTPEHVVDKASKLETIYDRIGLVRTRFQLIRQVIENEVLQQKLALLQNGAGAGELAQLDAQLQKALRKLKRDEAFLRKCNRASERMSDRDIERLRRIAAQTYRLNGKDLPYLTPNELYNLSVRRGTLNVEERKVIENHALVSFKMLKQLPFPKNLARVPEYAGGHHEKLDGSGYPFGLQAESLPLQARIMAVADIFEALTAKDRPYKSPMKLSQALRILKNMSEQRHIDPDIYRLFIGSGIYLEYALRELNKEQIDVIPEGM